MGEHSPGPWRVDDSEALPQALANPHLYSWDVVDANGDVVCEVDDIVDARLIAVAPAMRELLERLLAEAGLSVGDQAEIAVLLGGLDSTRLGDPGDGRR